MWSSRQVLHLAGALNLLVNFIYIPVSFAYVLPHIYYQTGVITPKMRSIPQRSFMVLGVLDGSAGLMQMFCATFIVDGSLFILLQQATFQHPTA